MHDVTKSGGVFLNESRCLSGSGDFGLSSGTGFPAQDPNLSSGSFLSGGSFSSAHSLGLMLRLASRGGVYFAGGRRHAAAAALTAVIGLATPAAHALNVSGSTTVSSGLVVDNGASAANNPMSVFSGGTAVSTSVGSGGSLSISNGGVTSDTIIGSLGSQFVRNGGIASGTTIGAAGWDYISSGGSAISSVINSSGTQTILNSGVAYNATISGGTQNVSNGGLASGTTILESGWQTVYAGGVASGTTISGVGQQTVQGTGVAVGTNVYSSGLQQVYNSGIASGTIIHSGGMQNVQNSNTVAIGTTIFSGGSQYVFNNASAVSTTVNSGGSQLVSNSGSAIDTTIGDGGWQSVYSNGSAINTTIRGGRQELSSGGIAFGTDIGSGGTQNVNYGGIASGTDIGAGGTQNVNNGGIANGTDIGAGGAQYIHNNGVANGTDIGFGGAQYIRNNGIASGTSIGTGGVLWGASGGSVVDLAGSVEGELRGYAAITGNVTIAAGGSLLPGSAYNPESTDNYGSMSITGNLTLSQGATYQVRMDSAGNCDTVAVTGSANVTGATFNHVTFYGASGGDYANTSAMVLSAGGGVIGTFGAATTTLAFYDPALDYTTSTEVWLRFVRSKDFGDYGLTYNQNSVAGGLDSLENLDPSNPLIQAVLCLNASEVARTYDLLSGEMHRSLAGGLTLMDRDFSRWILDRAGGKSLAGTILSASAPAFGRTRAFASIHPRALESRFEDSLWVDAGYARQRIDDDGNAGSYSLRGPEFTLGYDHAAPSGWIGGFAFRFADRDMKVRSRLSDADVDSYSAALHGGFQTAFGPGAARLVLGAAYTRHEIEGVRNVIIARESQRLRSDYHADSYQLFLEGAYAQPVGGVWLEPFAALAWTSMRVPGFVEKGGTAALRSHSYSQNNLSQLLGLRLVLPAFHRVHLEAQAGWRHTYGKLDKASSFSFVQGGGRFGIKGATLNRNEAVLDLKAAYQARDNLRIGLEAGAATGKRGTNLRGGAFVALEW